MEKVESGGPGQSGSESAPLYPTSTAEFLFEPRTKHHQDVVLHAGLPNEGQQILAAMEVLN